MTDTVLGADGREHKRALTSVFFESFVIDRTPNSATNAELVKLRKEVADQQFEEQRKNFEIWSRRKF